MTQDLGAALGGMASQQPAGAQQILVGAGHRLVHRGRDVDAEPFDAVIVASGRFHAPVLPAGLDGFTVVRRLRDAGEPAVRRAGIALAAWTAVGVGLWAMPRATGPHHWILATPFQYLAIALALRALPWRKTIGEGRMAGITLVVLATRRDYQLILDVLKRIDVVPRLTHLAGLELSTDLNLNIVAPDDALLSPAHQRETVYIAVHAFKGMAWEPYFRAVEAIAFDVADGDAAARVALERATDDVPPVLNSGLGSVVQSQ